MSTNIAPFTQALNFFSPFDSGVDPRTGLFLFSFPLAEVRGNNTLGPLLPLALTYSPLRIGNPYKLGNGVSLPITSYDRTNKLLALSTGEYFRTDDAGGAATPVIRQHKLNTFHVTTASKKIIIDFKSGERQILSEQEGNIYLLESIESSLGYSLRLSWKCEAGSRRLTDIVDANGKTVCHLKYGSDGVTVMLWPDTEETISFNLTFTDEYLTGISNTSVSPNLVWSLAYEQDASTHIGEQAPLKEVKTPTHLKESVQYKAGLKKFSFGDFRGGFPAVTQHQLSPGFGQPVQTTTFEYSAHNHLGYGNTLSQFVPDDDNLYNCLTPYDYSSVATHIGDKTNGARARSIERHYNNYHLLVSETEHEVGSRLTTREETEYIAEVGVMFANQPTTFQLPRTRTVTWDDGAGNRRIETTNFEYDLFGNLTRRAEHDGTVTLCEYYPANNSTLDCPADTNGFSRHIRSRTVIPYDDYVYKDVPTLKTEWKYKMLTGCQGSTLPWAVLPAQISHSAGGKHLSAEYFDYEVAPHGKDHGRLTTQTAIVHSDGIDYTTTRSFDYKLAHDQLTLRTTTTADAEPGNRQNTKKLTVIASSTKSALTGRLLSETDELGNQVAYRYDSLGRLIHQLAHPDKPDYSAEETWMYTLPSFDATVPAQLEYKDIFGNLARVSFDGLGRVIQEERKDHDGTLGWQTIEAHGYDALGRNALSTATDVLRATISSNATSLHYSIAREWDAWGGLRKQVGREDGLTENRTTDPVALTDASWMEGEGRLVTAKHIVVLDPRNLLPIQDLRLPYDTKKHSWVSEDSAERLSRHQVWDGANQLRQTVDENGHITQYDYDVYGRIAQTTLPDGSIIQRKYAPFSSAPLLVQLSLRAKGEAKSVVLGTQKFDGLGRLVEASSGGRHPQTFHYASDANRHPSIITQSDGAIVRVRSNVHLNEAPTEVVASRNGSKTLTQSFMYDLHTGQMKQANEQGSCENKWISHPSGRLRSETQDILSGNKRTSEFEYSLAGTLQHRTNFDGSAQQLGYSSAADTVGEMIRLSEPGVIVDVEQYDGLQRPVMWTTRDEHGNRLATSVAFDSFGRETRRTFTHNGNDVRVLEQTWYPNSQLKQRTLTHNGRTLCVETFVYDVRDRLVTYNARGEQLPIDPYGNAFMAQSFIFDALDNIIECRTTLNNGEVNISKRYFEYVDPCQLSAVTNTLTSQHYPAKIHLRYDTAGRLIRDDAARTLDYDAFGRLSAMKGPEGRSDYGYDAADRMVWQRVEQNSSIHRMYYHGEELTNEWIGKCDQEQNVTKDFILRPVVALGNSIAQRETNAGTPSTMLACVDDENRILCAITGDKKQEFSYTPSGFCAPLVHKTNA